MKKISLIMLLCFNLFAYTGEEIKVFGNLAVHSYDKSLSWYKDNSYTIIENNKELNIVVLEKHNQTFIVFRGTACAKDVYVDFLQHFGLNNIDMKHKIFSKGINNKYSNSSKFIVEYVLKKPILIGHSLGGGVASYCGLTHGLPTVAFNPAPLSDETLKSIDLSKDNNISNYISYNKIQFDLVSSSALLKNKLIGDINLVEVDIDENLTLQQKVLKIHSMKTLVKYL